MLYVGREGRRRKISAGDKLVDLAQHIELVADETGKSLAPQVPQCSFCGSILTRACESIRCPGRLTEIVDGFIDLPQLIGGSETGCPDCVLLHNAVKLTHSSNYVDESSVRVVLVPRADATDRRVLKIKFSMWWNLRGYKSWKNAADVTLAYERAIIQEKSEFLESRWEIFRIQGPPASHELVNVKWSSVVARTLPSRDTSSIQAYKKVRTWIDTCFEEHENCRKHMGSRLPKRVLQITGSLVCLRELEDTQGRYACLSHCWGEKGPSLKLTRASSEKLRRGLTKAEMPRTFADAVEICSKLHIAYIWIDALCIMQDDLDDWEEAAKSMASIYENSYVTIAASWSHNSSGGCFSSIQDTYYYEEQSLGHSGLYARRVPPPFPDGSSYSGRADWPLLKRGWVFQERILAPRIVHYAKHQLYWECNSCFMDEYGLHERHFRCPGCNHDDLKRSLSTPKYRLDSTNAYWRNTVALYTNLEFTYGKDVLPALAGIVERDMRYRKDDVYIAGMWEKTLLQDLAFYNNFGANFIRENSQAPTWSWASLEGSIGFLEVQVHPSVNLVKLRYERTSPANIGQITSASLRISGPILLAKFEPPHMLKPLRHELDSLAIPTQTINAISNLEIKCISGCHEFRGLVEDTHYTILILSSCDQDGSCAAILLQPVSTGNNLLYKKVDAVLVKYRHEVAQAFTSIEKDAERCQSYVERAPTYNTSENREDTSSTSTLGSHDVISEAGVDLMHELIKTLPVKEVKII